MTELLERYNVQCTSSNVHSLGKNLVKNLTDLLRNISWYHEYLSDRGERVPDMFKTFATANDYISKKNAKPRLSAKEHQGLVECLSGTLQTLGSAKVISYVFIIN